MWFFVNGMLLTDLSNIHKRTVAISGSQFKLIVGKRYSISIFIAHRLEKKAHYTLSTSFEIEDSKEYEQPTYERLTYNGECNMGLYFENDFKLC